MTRHRKRTATCFQAAVLFFDQGINLLRPDSFPNAVLPGLSSPDGALSDDPLLGILVCMPVPDVVSDGRDGSEVVIDGCPDDSGRLPISPSSRRQPQREPAIIIAVTAAKHAFRHDSIRLLLSLPSLFAKISAIPGRTHGAAWRTYPAKPALPRQKSRTAHRTALPLCLFTPRIIRATHFHSHTCMTRF